MKHVMRNNRQLVHNRLFPHLTWLRISSGVIGLLLLWIGLTSCSSTSETVLIVTEVTPPPMPPTATVAPVLAQATVPAETATIGIQHVCLVIKSNGMESNYNRLLQEGVQAAVTDYQLQSAFMVSNEPGVANYLQALEQCVALDTDVIVLGFNPDAEAITSFVSAHPNIFFVGVEYPLPAGPNNYTALQIRSDQSGFLAGYLAGLVTTSNIVAGIYGPDYPPLKAFRHGFEQGVALAAQTSGREVTTLGIYMDSFDDRDGGAAQALAFIEQGADVIFGAAGITGSAGIRAAAQAGVAVIGVDEDEYLTTFGGGQIPGSEYIISSALKRVDIGIREILAALIEEQDFAPGGTYLLGAREGAIGFAGPHQADVPAEIYQQLAEIERQLAQGTITTGVDPQTGELLAR